MAEVSWYLVLVLTATLEFWNHENVRTRSPEGRKTVWNLQVGTHDSESRHNPTNAASALATI